MKKVVIILLLIVFVANVGVVASDLDSQFEDRTGDMVADPPQDEAEWQDPDSIIFSYTPAEDPAVYRRAWSDFLDHMEEVTGRNVMFYNVESYSAQLEALRAGRLHVAGVNTGSVPIAVNEAGFVPFAIMAEEDGSYGYEMEIIVREDSDITDLEDVKGKEVALVSPTSNSGYRAPTSLLYSELGIRPDEDYETNFTGRHDNSIMGVAEGDYEVAAIANSILGRMHDQGNVDKDEFRTIYKSETFPTSGYGYANDLHPDLAEKIVEAFMTFDWSGTSLYDAFEPDAKFISVDYKTEWEVIRTIDEAAEEIE